MNQLFDQLNTNPHYAQLLDALNDGIIYENVDGRIVFANKRYCQMAGQSLSELTDQSSVNLIYPLDRERYLSKTASRNRIRQEAYSTRIQSKTGQVFDTMVSVQAIFDDQDIHIGNLAVLTDITELQRQKDALEESEKKFKTLLDGVNEGVFILAQGRLLEANDRFFEIHGYSPGELIGELIPPILLTPESNRIVQKTLTLNNQEFNQETPLELTGLRKDGSEFPLLASSRRITYHGQPTLIVSVLDLTDLRKREVELGEMKHRYEEIARHSGTFLWEVDANGLNTYIDQVAEKVIGYHPDEVIGKMHFYDFHPDKDRDSFKKAAFEVFRNKEEFRGLENPMQTKDGSIIWVSTYGIALLNPDGSLRGYRGSDTDITETIKTRQALHNYQAQISHAERLAGLGTMVAAMCHEINQPLTVLNLTLQELLHQLKKNDIPAHIVAQYIQDCLNSVSNSMSILNKFRKSSRLNDPLDPKDIHLSELLENLRDVFRGQCQKHHVRIIMAPSIHPAAGFQTECDLEQILFILIHNAIDASAGPDAHEIRIGSECKENHLILSVSDQGTGIAADDQDNIFVPFFTTKSRDEGTGLGLAIVKRILDYCGGQITCSSHVGKGTTFTVTLPIENCQCKELQP